MKTGIIKAIYPDGEFDTDYGHLYAYKMLIQFQGEQNQTEGGINSKSSPYPMGNGDEITVEIKNTQHGVKFKKVNPQYAQGGSQGGGQSSQGQSSGGRNYDAENRGKCRTQFIKAILTNSGMFKMDAESKVYIDGLVQYAMTGVIPPQPQTAKYTGNSTPDDDIPF